MHRRRRPTAEAEGGEGIGGAPDSGGQQQPTTNAKASANGGGFLNQEGQSQRPTTNAPRLIYQRRPPPE